MPPAESNEDEIVKYEIFWQVVANKLNLQAEAAKALEAKVGVLFGFVGVIVTGLFGFIAVNQIVFQNSLFRLGMVGLLGSLLFLTQASYAKGSLNPPKFSNLYNQDLLSRPLKQFVQQLSADAKHSYEHNLRIHNGKGRSFNYGLILLFTSLVILVLSL